MRLLWGQLCRFGVSEFWMKCISEFHFLFFNAAVDSASAGLWWSRRTPFFVLMSFRFKSVTRFLSTSWSFCQFDLELDKNWTLEDALFIDWFGDLRSRLHWGLSVAPRNPEDFLFYFVPHGEKWKILEAELGRKRCVQVRWRHSHLQ